MDTCLQHSRATVGPCMWCGKKLCDKCITRQEGLKLYCEKCHAQLHFLPRAKLPTPKKNIVTNGDQPWISKP